MSIHEILLGHSYVHLFMYYLWLFSCYTGNVEKSWDKDYMAHKGINYALSCPLYKKFAEPWFQYALLLANNRPHLTKSSLDSILEQNMSILQTNVLHSFNKWKYFSFNSTTREIQRPMWPSSVIMTGQTLLSVCVYMYLLYCLVLYWF